MVVEDGRREKVAEIRCLRRSQLALSAPGATAGVAGIIANLEAELEAEGPAPAGDPVAYGREEAGSAGIGLCSFPISSVYATKANGSTNCARARSRSAASSFRARMPSESS